MNDYKSEILEYLENFSPGEHIFKANGGTQIVLKDAFRVERNCLEYRFYCIIGISLSGADITISRKIYFLGPGNQISLVKKTKSFAQ